MTDLHAQIILLRAAADALEELAEWMPDDPASKAAPDPMGKTAPHCVIKLPGTLLCKGCKGEYRMTLPIPVRMLTALIEAFVVEHRGCAPIEVDAGETPP